MEFRGRILVIDDEAGVRRLLRDELQEQGFEVVTTETGEEGLSLAAQRPFDLALVDLGLPGLDGLGVLKKMGEIPCPPDTIVMTGCGDVQTAKEAMRLGAREFISKPFELSQLIPCVGNVVNRKQSNERQSVRPALTAGREDNYMAVCPSSVMKKVYDEIDKVACTDTTVLVQGETGVGKDVTAREIHMQSHRRGKPYIVVDCGLLNGNLAESELYGHRRGAFSGAADGKIGLVEASEGGTIFLDEIGNIDLEVQKKFLRFLETKRYRRVGDIGERRVDTRIILATNVPLEQAARNGAFRPDLLYRLDGLAIRIPPLRERPEDIPVLVEHFLKADSHLAGRSVRVTLQAMELLTRYPWPGNVRELRSVIVKTVVFAESDVIKPGDLANLVACKKPAQEQFCKRLRDVEKEHIVKILKEVGGNQTQAAQILGINRRSLYNKIRKHAIFAQRFEPFRN